MSENENRAQDEGRLIALLAAGSFLSGAPHGSDDPIEAVALRAASIKSLASLGDYALRNTKADFGSKALGAIFWRSASLTFRRERA